MGFIYIKSPIMCENIYFVQKDGSACDRQRLKDLHSDKAEANIREHSPNPVNFPRVTW